MADVCVHTVWDFGSFGHVHSSVEGFEVKNTNTLGFARGVFISVPLFALYQANGRGTDIFGALWHLKTLMDSDRQVGPGATHEIWIFSDMINETPTLMM